MRIGIVLAAAPAYSETFFRQKIAGLQAKGLEPVLFSGTETNHFDLCPVICAPPVYRSRLRTAWRALLQLLWLACIRPGRFRNFFCLERKQGSSIFRAFQKTYLNSHILSCNLDYLHFGFATQAIGREHVAASIGARMAVSLRGFDLNVYPLKHPGCYNLLWSKVDKVHYLSDDLYQTALKTGLSPQKECLKITPAVDTQKFRRSRPFSAVQQPVRFLTVARLHWSKGLSHTLEALAALQKEGIDFRYQIIGEGPEHENILYSAKQLGLGERVTLPGKKRAEAVKSAFEEADIYLQYSLTEGFCNAALEAQAMELLCIGSDVGGMGENIEDGVTGWLVPARRPDLLASKILEVLQISPERQAAVRRAARLRVQTTFGYEAQIERFIKFYRQ